MSQIILFFGALQPSSANNAYVLGSYAQPWWVVLLWFILSQYISIQHMNSVQLYDYLTCLLASDSRLPLNAWEILLNDVWLQALPKCMSESLRWYLHTLLKFTVTTRITASSFSLLIIKTITDQHVETIDR